MATREIVQLRDKETGDISELRDKALKEAAKSSTPSDATNNSVIPLETENGETIKIKAESLMKAFATMINSNSKSTITTLFGALSADNNTEFGAINMANLASVLGVEIFYNADPNIAAEDNRTCIKLFHIRNSYVDHTPSPYCNILSLSGTIDKNNSDALKITQIALGYGSRDVYIKYRYKDGNANWSGWS